MRRVDSEDETSKGLWLYPRSHLSLGYQSEKGSDGMGDVWGSNLEGLSGKIYIDKTPGRVPEGAPGG